MKTEEQVKQELAEWLDVKRGLPDSGVAFNEVISRVEGRIAILKWILDEEDSDVPNT